jgi:hypothetical protein
MATPAAEPPKPGFVRVAAVAHTKGYACYTAPSTGDCATNATVNKTLGPNGSAVTDSQGRMTLETRQVVLQLDPSTKVKFQPGTNVDAALSQGGVRVGVIVDANGRNTYKLQTGGTTTISVPVNFQAQVVPDTCPPSGEGLETLVLFTARIEGDSLYVAVPSGAAPVTVSRGSNNSQIPDGMEANIPNTPKDVNAPLPTPQSIKQEEDEAWQETLAEWSAIPSLILRPPDPETGNVMKGEFLSYWSEHGGLPQQGLPISGEFQEVSPVNSGTYKVQYFERAVFEYHPENAGTSHEVLLSLLGTFRYRDKYGTVGAPNQVPNRSASSILYPETGKRLGGKFLDYWQTHGGLAQQGYPISDEFTERSDLDGNLYTVQYFERAVFELHPKNQPPFDVLLSQLGTFRFRDLYKRQDVVSTFQSQQPIPSPVATQVPNKCPDQPPTQPVQLNPRAGATVTLTGTQGLSFEWTRAYHASGVTYNLEIEFTQSTSKPVSWKQVVARQGLTNTLSIVPNLADGQYRWRVEAVARNTLTRTISDWSSFSIGTKALGAGCLDLQTLQPQQFPGPTFSLYPLNFTNPRVLTKSQALPLALVDRQEDLDGKPELYVGFSKDGAVDQPLFVDFPQAPFPKGVRNVDVELRHFNAANVLAVDSLGRVVDSVTQPTQDIRATLKLGGPDIRRLQFNVIETLIYKICWVP